MSAGLGKIAVVGAGSVGCYLGGRLLAGGSQVCLIGREALQQTIVTHGLTLSDLHGATTRLAPQQTTFSTDLADAQDAALVLVTVKSAATTSVASELASTLRPGAVVISFQNGLHNAEELAGGLPQHTVIPGMVPFNIVNRGDGAFHQGSGGELTTAAHDALLPWLAHFERAGLPLSTRTDMPAVFWAKLLINLNNAVNALSGLPLKAELAQRAYRQCVAMAQREALHLLTLEDIRPARLTPLPASWVPGALSVPDALFKLLRNRMLAIDPLARSSMWEDLERGRPTEIDWINGEVVQLAARHRQPAPVNAKLIALIREAEQGGKRDWTGAALLAALRESTAQDSHPD